MFDYKLKAQIVRMSNSCDIIPKGVYKVKLEEGQEITGFEEIEKEEEQKREKLDFYTKLENWVHISQEIIKSGRMTKEEIEFNEEIDDDAKEVIRNQLKKLDCPKSRLMSIVNDKGSLKSG